MLNFLNTDKNQLKNQKNIKRTPQINFGISLQTPTTFKKTYTMVNDQTYLNPFYKYESQRLQPLSVQKINTLQRRQPVFSNMSNVSQLQMQQQLLPKIINQNHNNNYKVNYKKQKGQFTNFIQQHIKHVTYMGPIQGCERKNQKNQLNKSNIIQKKLEKLTKLKNNHSQSSNDSKISELVKKYKLRSARQKENLIYRKRLQKQSNLFHKLPGFNSKSLNTSITYPYNINLN